MFEKTLHAGNIVAAFGAIVTATDLTLAGGAGTTIGAALSAYSLLKPNKGKVEGLAKSAAPIAKAALDASNLPEGQHKLVLQLLEKQELSVSLLVDHALIEEDIASALRADLAANAKDPAHRQPKVLDAFEAVICATLKALLDETEQQEGLHFSMTRQVLHQTKLSGEAKQMMDLGIRPKVIVEMAQRFTANAQTLEQAWPEVLDKLDIAKDVQRRGNAPSNHGDFVDEVLRRAAALSAEGKNTEAGDEIASALDEAEAGHRARMGRLIETGVEVALLEGDEEKAAALLIRQADLDAGGQADVAALSALFIEHYREGRDKGLAQPLELAIALSRATLPRCTLADERGAMGNALGSALATLGERESGTEKLEQSFSAYRAALEELPRDRVPLEWAGAQMNLGNALLTLGERERGAEWVEQAVHAYRAALEELSPGHEPLDWAATQMNLGNALQTLGERENSIEHLEQAVSAYRAALVVWTRDRVPLKWAMTQMNLGNALRNLGEREGGTDQLEQAVVACRAALEKCTRDDVPLDWAMVQGNLASCEMAFFEKVGDRVHLSAARQNVEAALEVFSEAGASYYVAIAEGQLEQIAALEAG